VSIKSGSATNLVRFFLISLTELVISKFSGLDTPTLTHRHQAIMPYHLVLIIFYLKMC